MKIKIPVTQKLTNIEIAKDNICCKYFIESLCLDIQKNIIIKILHQLLKMLNINEDDNEEKLYEIYTNFIRKLRGLFFTVIGEKENSNIPLNKIYYLKNTKLTCLYGSMDIKLDSYPPYSDSLSDIFETNVNSNLRCCHEYTNYSGKKQLITWVSK